MSFKDILDLISKSFDDEWKELSEFEKSERINLEKEAIMGIPTAVNEYKNKINEILNIGNLLDSEYPPWFSNLTDAVFNELYGLSGIAPWAYDETEEYKRSSSAKLIGENLFCLIDGKSILQPQKIGKTRREQLKRAFLMSSPRERLEEGFHELYLYNGIRVTVFSGDRTKEDQDVIVFRKYLMKKATFEDIANLGTIPTSAIPLFKDMIKIGFNVIFSGPVRSGKTTFLQVWQSYEDKNLEGLTIATDPETRWNEILPDAPIMQLISDGEDLKKISKSLLRGDNDYVILEEMRDAASFNLMLDITQTGIKRSKGTVHTSDPINLPYRMASKLKNEYGLDMNGTLIQIFTNFNYIFLFDQLEKNRGKKILKGIFEYEYDIENDRPVIHRICEYDELSSNWNWHYHLGRDKKAFGIGNEKEINEMEDIMKKLESRNPILRETVIYPKYYRSSLSSIISKERQYER